MGGIAGQSLKMSLQNIRANKTRSFLTMLGIIIGVASVIALITIVSGASDSIMNQVMSLGVGDIQISAQGTALKQGLSESELALLGEVDGVVGVAPEVSLDTTSIVDGNVYDKTTVTGESAVYFLNNDVIESGRALTAADMGGDSFVCIVDHQFIDTALWGKKVIGSKIRINGYDFTVIGIKKKDTSIFAQFMNNEDKDGKVIIPYKNALMMTGSRNITSAMIFTAENADSETVTENLRIELKNIFNNAKGAYSVTSMDSMGTMMGSIKGMLQAMLGGVASIALLVGGIGIMNMMLVSVSERTKEIGLRKALGAEPVRIQMQFLIEAVVLSVCGGVIGVIFGEVVAFIAAAILKTTFSVEIGAVVLGLGFSIAVGVVFGWAPARNASKLNPIDALRSE